MVPNSPSSPIFALGVLLAIVAFGEGVYSVMRGQTFSACMCFLASGTNVASGLVFLWRKRMYERELQRVAERIANLDGGRLDVGSRFWWQSL